jgi:hypothetical protein
MRPNGTGERWPTRDDAKEAEKACKVGRPLQWLVGAVMVRRYKKGNPNSTPICYSSPGDGWGNSSWENPIASKSVSKTRTAR